MIRLHVLGLQDLCGADGTSLGAVSLQPKRFALLAYLALTRGRFHRRDALVALLWPELDQQGARRALRQAVYALRQTLGADILVGRGDEELAIDRAHLWCDANALLEAADAGRDEEAVALYRGELLHGFHLADAGDAFEDWLTRERRRLVEVAATCARALADREDAAGNPAGAARWALEAADLAPHNEDHLRRAVRALAASGDRGGALMAYEKYAAWLAAELGAEPSPETHALATGLRSTTEKPAAPVGVRAPVSTTISDPAPAAEATPDRAAAHASPSDGALRRPAASVSRRVVWSWRVAWGALAALVLVVATFAVRARLGPTPRLNRRRVIVAVFENRTGDPGLEVLGDMSADWITRGLLETGLVDVVDAGVVFVQGRSPSGRPVDPLTLARRNGAGTVVAGSYYRVGDSLLFHASVIDATSGSVLRALSPITTPIESPVRGVDRLRRRVMAALATTLDSRFATRVASPSADPPSFEVYRAFVDGWDAFWLNDRARSLALFEWAMARDSSFDAAATAAASAAANFNHCALTDSIAHAFQRRTAVTEIDRLSVGVSEAMCQGQSDAMLQLALERERLLPRSSSAQMTAAAAALWANRPIETIAILSRLDPSIDLGWMPADGRFDFWGNLAEAFHQVGRHGDELALAQSVPPEQSVLGGLLLRARALAALGRPAAVAAVLDTALALPADARISPGLGLAPETDGRAEYVGTPAWVAFVAAAELYAHGDSTDARVAAGRAIGWLEARPPDERATPEERLHLAWALSAARRWSDARRVAAALVADDSANVDYRGTLGWAAAAAGDTATARAIDRWLTALPAHRAGWGADVYRAHIAAASGRSDAAVALVRDAMNHGAEPWWIHVDPGLAPLRARADFAMAIAPRP